MSGLDKTFPTNDCSMCILSPKLVECGRHPNIEIITLANVLDVQGTAGNFTVTVFQRARYVDMDKCIACGTCAEKCPRKIPDEYNYGLSFRKAIYVKYPQAVPLKYTIDKKHCIYFEKGKCRACEKFCPAKAINFQDQDRQLKLNVGSVILAPGFQVFDPENYQTYYYGRHPNVVTSMEFERILSASGPYEGHLARPSDRTEPRSIAWIQCIGSRDINNCQNGYCSAVCCMYAIKEAIVAKEHSHGELACSIFFMDMRTAGKDFEKYYERAREEYGVKFIRSRIHGVEPVAGSDDLCLRYINERGEFKEKTFNLIVLSVGLEVSPEVVELAERLHIELTPDGFVATSAFQPVSTSRPGIFVCGAFQGPKDIPFSVMEASAAAAQSGVLLASARGSLTKKASEPPQIDVTGQDPRIGVFVCHCGINIGSVVNVPQVVEHAKRLPHVVYAEENLFTCSQDTQDKIKDVIARYGLNRVVVASCSPRTHEALFQQTIKEAGLNKYLFELANIRDQDSWVHQSNPEAATQKAKDLVRMAVAKVALQQPLKEHELGVSKKALIIGGGITGMNAALALADQGYPVTLVERNGTLGGHGRKLLEICNGELVAPYLSELISKVTNHPLITVLLGAEVVEVKGFVGKFSTVIAMPEKQTVVDHGVVVLATGAEPYKPVEYHYGESDRIFLPLELDEAIRQRREVIFKAKSAVFIQCVGSREPDRPYCSRVCCTHSIQSALQLKKLNPGMDIYILYRDIRTYGLREHLYKEARSRGIIFIRYTAENKPRVELLDDGKLRVSVLDHVLLRDVNIEGDILVLATALVPGDTEGLAKLFKVPLNPEGFFLEAHMKLRPVDFATDGVFVAGLAHYPKPTDECITQAKAAAARAATILAKDKIITSGIVAAIDEELCTRCGLCLECCPFEAIEYDEEQRRYVVREALCKGCGTCAAACPSEAATLLGFSHQQLYAQIDNALNLGR